MKDLKLDKIPNVLRFGNLAVLACLMIASGIILSVKVSLTNKWVIREGNEQFVNAVPVSEDFYMNPDLQTAFYLKRKRQEIEIFPDEVSFQKKELVFRLNSMKIEKEDTLYSVQKVTILNFLLN